MITIKLSNKVAYTLIAVLLILTVGLVVYAYSNTPNPGHGADQIIVNINGQEKTLQQAIDEGDFGGRSCRVGTQICCVNNWKWTCGDTVYTDSGWSDFSLGGGDWHDADQVKCKVRVFIEC